jgi:Tol biopolymer transport system component
MDQFDGWPMGFDLNGSLYYGVSTTASNVYIAKLDSTGLNFEGEFELASSQFVGSTTMGDFSSDGRFLAYRAGRAGHRADVTGPGDWVFVVYSVATSGERIVSTSPAFIPDTRMSGPRWSPDGQSLLVCGTGREGGYGLYKVDMETGLVTLIHGPCEKNVRSAAWSQDGSSIYIRSLFRLSRLELATGRETTLYKGTSWGPWSFDVSPDGQWLAFYPTEDSLAVMPSVGGGPREVVHWDEEVQSTHPFVRWTPDGEHLLFRKRKKELWKVHAETGAQQQIGQTVENLVGAAMHPDGRQIAFTVEQKGSELWVMENFLPD